MMEISKGLCSRLVGIVDYGGGNIGSVANAIQELGYEPVLLKEKEDYRTVPRIIFPGVGNFKTAMRRLRSDGNIDVLLEEIKGGKPFLGICLGFQVLFEESEEGPGVKGLGLFPGRVVRFSVGKIPHIGWNKVEVGRQCILEDGFYYFVNSYYPQPDDEEIKVGFTEYNSIEFCSAIESGNIWGVQFHPEKSGNLGLRFLRRWLRC